MSLPARLVGVIASEALEAAVDLPPELDVVRGEDVPVFATLAELQNRPELLRPPECVIGRLAHFGRTTALCGPDKSGKSTLMRHAAAALTRDRHFLGEPTGGRHGRVVWLGLEEALGDAVRGLVALDADPERIQLVTLSPPDLLDRTRALLGDWPADLVVVDSLAEYARVTREGDVPENGDAAGWSAVVRPLVALSREADAAVVILHHVRKSDGVYRGSTEIAAAVDALLEMRLPASDEDQRVRHIRGRARWTVEPFSIALRDGRYELEGSTPVVLSTDARVLLHIEANPGASKSGIRKAAGGRATKVDAAIGQLLKRGAIENRGIGKGTAYYSTTQSPRMAGL